MFNVLRDRLRVRNLSIIAHVDHGKTSLSDCLLRHAGQLSIKRQGALELDNLQEEKERGITIQSSAVTLLFDDVTHSTLADGRTLALERVAHLTAAPTTSSSKGLPPTLRLCFTSTTCHSTLRPTLCAPLSTLACSPACSTCACARRGSAVLELRPDTPAPLVDALCAADGLALGGRAARVCRADPDGGPLQRVAHRAAQLGVPVPTFDIDIDSDISKRDQRHALALEWLASHTIEALPSFSSSNDGLLINLIDSPGHVDFTAEVTAALRLTDGGLVLVDAVGGPAAQTDAVLRQAMRENVLVTLFLNKVDKALSLLPPDDLYDTLERSIDSVNASLNGVQAPLSFKQGTVALGSAYEGWAISVDSIVDLFSNRISSPEKLVALRKRLATKRGFVELALAPVCRMREALLEKEDVALAFSYLEKVDRAPTGRVLEEWRRLEDQGDFRALLRLALSTMLPLAPVVTNMIAKHLPSPFEGQLRRAHQLYKVAESKSTDDDNDDDDDINNDGDNDDQQNVKVAHDREVEIFDGVRKTCASSGVLAFVAKRVEFNGRSFSLARVLSGTLHIGSDLRQLPSDSDQETKGKVTALALVVGAGRDIARVEKAEAGTIVLIGGLSIANGTVTDISDAHKLTATSALVSHVIGVALRVAPSCTKSNAAKRLVDALRNLTSADPALKVEHNAAGELVLLGAGELHLDVATSRLARESGLPLVKSEPVVTMRETIVGPSERTYLGKSSNKHNRIFAIAEPLEQEWRDVLIEHDASSSDSARRVALRAAGIAMADVRRVICFGNTDNVVVDRTSGISLQPIRDSLRLAFEALERDGVLAQGQQLTGVKLVIVDAKYHADNNHRAPSQVQPAAMRAFSAALLGAPIRLVQPMCQVEVSVKNAMLNDVYSVLHQRRASCEPAIEGEHGFVLVKALLGVCDSLGLPEALRRATKGQAFPSLGFVGWQTIDRDVRTHAETTSMIDATRARYGLEPGVPTPIDDRL